MKKKTKSEKTNEVGITKHMWLDCSVSWFVKLNGQNTGGECYSKSEAEGYALSLAESIGADYIGEGTSNEIFS